MPHRQNNSRIAALLHGRNRRRRTSPSLEVCPSCGEPLVAADHAVLLEGAPHHAACVLYRGRVAGQAR
jgi:uncharacterized protein with PIN domain